MEIIPGRLSSELVFMGCHPDVFGNLRASCFFLFFAFFSLFFASFVLFFAFFALFFAFFVLFFAFFVSQESISPPNKPER